MLETAVGFNVNMPYYNSSKVKKLFACDWVDMSLNESAKKITSNKD